MYVHTYTHFTHLMVADWLLTERALVISVHANVPVVVYGATHATSTYYYCTASAVCTEVCTVSSRCLSTRVVTVLAGVHHVQWSVWEGGQHS